MLQLLDPGNASSLLNAAQTFKTLEGQATRSRPTRIRVQPRHIGVPVAAGGGFGAQPFANATFSQPQVQASSGAAVPLLQRFQSVLFDQYGQFESLTSQAGNILSAASFVTQNEALIRQSWSIRGLSGGEVTIIKDLNDNWANIQATVAKADVWNKTTRDFQALKNGLDAQVQASTQAFLDANLAAQMQANAAALQLQGQTQAAVNAATANQFADPNFLLKTFQPSVDAALAGLLGDDASNNLLGSMGWLQGGIPALRGLDAPFRTLQQGFTGIAGIATTLIAPVAGALNGLASGVVALGNKQAFLLNKIQDLNALAADQAATVALLAQGQAGVVGHFWDNTVKIMRELSDLTTAVADAIAVIKGVAGNAQTIGNQLMGGFTMLGGHGGLALGAFNPADPNSIRGLIRGLPADPLQGKLLPLPG